MTPPPRTEDRPLAALLAPDVLAMLEESPHHVAAETEELHARDLAAIAEALEEDQMKLLLRVLPPARAADVLEYLDEQVRTTLLEEMSTAQAAQLVAEMTPDDRADVLDELEEERADEILSEIPAEARQETERLLAYEPDTAGGLMTTEFVSVPGSLTVEQALAQVRALARGRKEAMHAIYIVDADGVLRGVLSLRELLVAPEGVPLSEVAWSEVVSVPASADRTEVAQVTSEYDLVAVPVVDERRRLVGVITVDDVIDAIVEEQTEDVQRLGAVQPLESPYLQAGFWELLRKRGGWLVVLFVGGFFTTSAMRGFEGTLERAGDKLYFLLSTFLPLIISAGGNSGSQSATLVTRALAVGDVELRDAFRVLRRELLQGICLGLFLGAIGYGRAILYGTSPTVGVIVGTTLVLIVICGTLVGASLPLVFTRFGFDPAVASSPFVASLVDVAGIVIYFSIAIQLLQLG